MIKKQLLITLTGFLAMVMSCSGNDPENAYNQDFTPTTDPWVLNGLFANRTLTPDPVNGLNQPNYAFIEDFISIQKNNSY